MKERERRHVSWWCQKLMTMPTLASAHQVEIEETVNQKEACEKKGEPIKS